MAQPARSSLAGVPTRRLVALLVAALAAALATVAVTAWTANDEVGEEVAGAAPSAEPLTGRPPLLVLPTPEAAGKAGEVRRAAVAAAVEARPDDVEAWLALAGVEMELERREESAQAIERAAALAPDDARVEAAGLTLAYDPADPQPTIDALSALAERAPDVPLVRFQLGVAQLWAGHASDAQDTLVALRDSAPEGLYRTAADDLLHPQMAPGYPPYFTSFEPDDGGVEALTAIAEERPSDVRAQLQLGAALQAAGRRDDAAAADARALTLDPDHVEAQVARAVNGFDKDDPSSSFAILGPLANDHPDVPAARFHLAVALLWLRDFERARAEFRQVEREAPGTRLARLAGELATRSG